MVKNNKYTIICMDPSPSSIEHAVLENWRGKYWRVGSTCCHSVLSDRSLWTQRQQGTGSSSATRSPGRAWTVGTWPKTKQTMISLCCPGKSIRSGTGSFTFKHIPPLCHSSLSGCICPRSDGQPSPTPSAPNSESQWGCDNEGPTWAAPRRTRHSSGLCLLPLYRCEKNINKLFARKVHRWLSQCEFDQNHLVFEDGIVSQMMDEWNQKLLRDSFTPNWEDWPQDILRTNVSLWQREF